jgi:hypothetical protein
MWNIAADNGPGTLIWDSGDFATTSTGLVTATISWAATPGLYWIGCISDHAITVEGMNSVYTPAGLGYVLNSSSRQPLGDLYEDISYPSGGLPNLTGTTLTIQIQTLNTDLIGIQ